MDKAGQPWKLIGAYLLLLAISLLPIALNHTLPLSDYSNHLARMHILLHTPASPVLQRFYEIHWAIIPNLAMEVIVPALARLMPLEVAGKIFVGCALATISSGTIALHYAVHRRWSYWPFVAFLFLYNSMLILGVLNYLFALGGTLWAAAAWVWFREREGTGYLALFYICAVVLFFAHLAAFGVYGLFVLSFEAGKWLRSPFNGWLPIFRRAAWVSGQFVVPAWLLMHGPTSGNASLVSYWGLFRKAVAPFVLFYNYSFVLDLFSLIVIANVLVLGFLSHRLVMSPDMKLPVGMLLAVFCLMPSTLFSSNYADYRMMPALAFLFIAGCTYVPGRQKERWPEWTAAALAGLFLVRMGVLAQQWRELDRHAVEYLQAIDRLPAGSRLFSAFARNEAAEARSGANRFFNAESMPSYAVIRRSAYVPLIFADPHVVPISFTPAYEKLAAEMPGSYFQGGQGAYFSAGHGPDWAKLKNNYDYLLIGHEEWFAKPLPPGLEPIYAGRDFRLFRVVPLARQVALKHPD